MSASGLLIIDKPAGITSHSVVAAVRRIMGTRKVGHAGTLDPMATGVLVIGVGAATRLLGHLALHDKAYSATMRLGATTVTDDADGDILEVADPAAVAAITDEQVDAAVEPLRGEILQVPTAISAIKVDGKRSYARVRAGEQVELKARPVTVSTLQITHRERTAGHIELSALVECSTGTYVRALARDIGSALGIGGYLTALRRTRVGAFDESGAITLERLEQLPDPRTALLPMGDAARMCFPTRVATAAEVLDIRNGRPYPQPVPGVTAVLDQDGSLVALVEPGPSAGDEGSSGTGSVRYAAVFSAE